MSVTRLSSYFSFKAKSYFWVSSSLLLKFLQFLLVILILFLVFPLFSFIDTLLKVVSLVSFSTSSFCCREQSFLFYHYFFLYSCSFHFLYLVLSFLFVFSFRFYFNVHFFFYSFTPPSDFFSTFFRSFTPFKFTFSPLLFQSNSLFLFLKAFISLLKPLSTGITYSHVYFHYRDSRVYRFV